MLGFIFFVGKVFGKVHYGGFSSHIFSTIMEILLIITALIGTINFDMVVYLFFFLNWSPNNFFS